ncbi:hypothetical protein AN396_01080 [Candidatus Epulonipiscium fishelsonii]|uniref:Uncharacterized protein n=1 Tax=Candidatus Epulonipiscium fishelsonii TaxID=77094 RepID=A0ACC8XCE7_9FIRM|nr:hypothetical protein AN396_01080 [Epulopiscium sp. SCG-B11WGA-EpuloA1]
MASVFEEEYDMNGFLSKVLRMYNNDISWKLEEERKKAIEEGALSVLANTYKLTNNLNLVYEAAATRNISEEVVNNYLKDQGLL